MSLVPLAALLACPRAPGHPVAWRDGVVLDFARFQAEVAGLAAALRAAGCPRGGLVAADGWRFAVGLFALMQAGAEVVVPPNNQPGTLAALSGAWDLLVDDDFPAQGAVPLVPLDAATCRLAFYTSGSTGAPKRVEKTLAQLEAEVAALDTVWGDTVAGAPVLATVAHQHVYGMTFRLLWPLAAGRPFAARAHEVWETLLAELPAGAVVVSSPAHLTRLGGIDPLPAAGRPRMVLTAGAPLPADAAADAARVFGLLPTEIFGSTETGAIATRRQLAADTPWQPLPGNRVQADAEGRLALASPWVDPAAWPAAWYTGEDLIEPLPDGGFRLLGRADRVAKIEGKRVGLPEVERLLASSPWVSEAAVVALGAETPELGAAVVPSALGRAELVRLGPFRFGRLLRRGLADALEAPARPRRWRFVDALPTAAMGKRPDRTVALLFAPPPLPQVTLPRVTATRTTATGVELDLEPTADLLWFDGHFPGRPILPGVVQIDWALHYARLHLGLTLPAARKFQVKFRAVIEPEDRLTLVLTHDAARGRLGFAYRRGVAICSSGQVALPP